ncbi:MAG TPA: alpha/beta hydrolase [Candidatus Limnocylindria bacterium]|nr:alpha/beta hydrolase [Candidatus Limnocylindria bacterium]
MPFELPVDPREERRNRISRWLGTAFGAVLVVLVVYFGYIGYEGSRQLTNADSDSTDCRTPSTLGWQYEAINYPIGSDALLAEQSDQAACAQQGARPGGEVVGPGGVRLAGWYIPAVSDIGAAGPTVILAHGWGSNKSDMLSRAEMLRDRYNLVLFDFRDHGQSEAGDTTQGVREAGDLRAMVDWLVEQKAPERIALLGVSMGGASAVTEAAGDDRIAAVILESTHSSLADAVQARLERSGYPLAIPASWATLLGALIRTGEDVSAADPILGIANLDERPVLIIGGGQDQSIGPDDAEKLRAAAEEAGSPAELETCEAAGHAGSAETCAEQYAAWVLGFLDRALAPAG